jgi:hypothetical protein
VVRSTPADSSKWADQVRDDIERALHERVTPAGTRSRVIESTAKGAAAWAFARLKKHSAVGVALAAGLGWVAADLVGVGELTMIVGFGYVAYEVLRKGLPLGEAVADERKLID